MLLPKFEADVVVGADGIHSVVQGHVTQPRPPVFSGRISYRGVLPAARIPGWERDEVGMWNGIAVAERPGVTHVPTIDHQRFRAVPLALRRTCAVTEDVAHGNVISLDITVAG